MKIAVINKIRCVLEINEVLAYPQPENFNPMSGRCFECVEDIITKKSYKAESEKLNNKLETKYLKCQKFIRKKHQTDLQFIFQDCIEYENINIDSFISIEKQCKKQDLKK